MTKHTHRKITCLPRFDGAVTSKSQIVMSNELAMSCYKLSVMANRMLLIAISKIDSYAELGVKDRPIEVRVHLTDILEFMPPSYRSRKTQVYKKMITAFDEIQDSRIFFETTGNEYQHEKHLEHWFCREHEYQGANQKKGHVTFRFNKNLTRHLTGLRGNFTKLNLSTALKFKTFYAFRLYTILMRYENIICNKVRGSNAYQVKISVPVLISTLMGLESKMAWGDFKFLFLDEAIKEVNTITLLYVHYETQANAKLRTVTDLKFEFTRKDKVSLKPVVPVRPRLKSRPRTKLVSGLSFEKAYAQKELLWAQENIHILERYQQDLADFGQIMQTRDMITLCKFHEILLNHIPQTGDHRMEVASIVNKIDSLKYLINRKRNNYKKVKHTYSSIYYHAARIKDFAARSKECRVAKSQIIEHSMEALLEFLELPVLERFRKTQNDPINAFEIKEIYLSALSVK